MDRKSQKAGIIVGKYHSNVYDVATAEEFIYVGVVPVF
jgi:hypothetical protein